MQNANFISAFGVLFSTFRHERDEGRQAVNLSGYQ